MNYDRDPNSPSLNKMLLKDERNRFAVWPPGKAHVKSQQSNRMIAP